MLHKTDHGRKSFRRSIERATTIIHGSKPAPGQHECFVKISSGFMKILWNICINKYVYVNEPFLNISLIKYGLLNNHGSQILMHCSSSSLLVYDRNSSSFIIFCKKSFINYSLYLPLSAQLVNTQTRKYVNGNYHWYKILQERLTIWANN